MHARTQVLQAAHDELVYLSHTAELSVVSTSRGPLVYCILAVSQSMGKGGEDCSLPLHEHTAVQWRLAPVPSSTQRAGLYTELKGSERNLR